MRAGRAFSALVALGVLIVLGAVVAGVLGGIAVRVALFVVG